MRQVQARDFDEVPFRADALEKHHQLQLEEDDGVDAGSPTFGVELARPVADKAQVQRCFEMAVEVVLGRRSSSETAIGSSRRRGLGGPSMMMDSWLRTGMVTEGDASSFLQNLAQHLAIRTWRWDRCLVIPVYRDRNQVEMFRRRT